MASRRRDAIVGISVYQQIRGLTARANTTQAHSRWQHIVASHEATDTLHRSMCLALYLPGGMVVAITVESVTSYIKE